MFTLAIIPARGGSSRIPRKNLALLGGVPLIAHTIRAAQGAPEVDRVCVSTDDPEIATVARDYGALVVRRPAALATAEAPTEPALEHAVEVLEQRLGERCETIVMLQPTSPLRPAARISEAVQLMVRSGCDSVVGVVPVVDYYFHGELKQGNRLEVGYDPQNRLRTQDIPPRYYETGALYVMTREQLMDRRCRMGGDIRAVVMSKNEGLDIDHLVDLQLCELLYSDSNKKCPRALPQEQV